MGKEIRILSLFDYNATTGFATVSQNIVAHLKKHFGNRLKLDIIAINFFGEPYQEDENTRVWPAIKMVVPGAGADEFGRHPLLHNLAQGNYDGVFAIQDLEVMLPVFPKIKEWNKKKKKEGRKQFKSVYYFPVDGALLPEWLDGIENFDVIVTYTEYAKNEVLKVRPDLKNKLRVILHGINPSHFYPLEEEKAKRFRHEYFGEASKNFIINATSRNQFRKNFPATILAFEKYKKQFDKDAFLYFHCNPKDYVGWDLRKIFKQIGMKEGVDFGFPVESMYDHGASIDLLNHIYNASDIYVSSNAGEGYGLTNIEVAMCKKPVITPYHTSLIEMSGYGKRFWMLKNFSPYISRHDSMIRFGCDPQEITELINKVKSNPNEAKAKIELAYQWALTQTWDIICKHWIKIFEDTFLK